jgi:hypothetical protein
MAKGYMKRKKKIYREAIIQLESDRMKIRVWVDINGMAQPDNLQRRIRDVANSLSYSICPIEAVADRLIILDRVNAVEVKPLGISVDGVVWYANWP